jgi:hypothetical protein
VRRVGAGVTRRGALAALLGSAALGPETALAKRGGDDPKSDGEHLFGRARHRNPRHDGDGKPNNNGHGNGHGHGRNRKGERGKGNGGRRGQQADGDPNRADPTAGGTGRQAGSDAASGVEMVSVSRSVGPGDGEAVEVRCPEGAVVTGGGFAGATSGRVAMNGPLLDEDETVAIGWRVDLREVAEAAEVTVYAFCQRARSR